MIPGPHVSRKSHVYRLAAVIARTHHFTTANAIRGFIPAAREILEELKAVDEGAWNKANNKAWLQNREVTEHTPEEVWPIMLDVIATGWPK